MRSIRLACLLVAAVAVAACGDDPVSYSAPVAINLKAKSDDTTNGVVTDEKSVTTESGNPYGAFVADARDALGGADPGRIEVDSVDVLLGASSTGVATLGEIFAGELEILFEMNDTDNTYPVASGGIDGATGSGPVGLAVSFDGEAVPDVDHAKLVGGGFKIVVRGPAATEFETKGADADLQVTFEFSAYE